MDPNTFPDVRKRREYHQIIWRFLLANFGRLLSWGMDLVGEEWQNLLMKIVGFLTRSENGGDFSSWCGGCFHALSLRKFFAYFLGWALGDYTTLTWLAYRLARRLLRLSDPRAFVTQHSNLLELSVSFGPMVGYTSQIVPDHCLLVIDQLLSQVALCCPSRRNPIQRGRISSSNGMMYLETTTTTLQYRQKDFSPFHLVHSFPHKTDVCLLARLSNSHLVQFAWYFRAVKP